MEIRYFSTSIPWAEYQGEWGLGIENQAHIVQFNVQPGDLSAFICERSGDKMMMKGRWGKSASDTVLLFNARREGIFSQNSFRFAMRDRRCIVPMDSFYHVTNHPIEGVSAYRVRPLNGKPSFAAALYSEDGSFYTLITRKVKSRIGDLVDRTPVLLESNEDIETWLSSKNMAALDAILTQDKTAWDFYVISSEIVHNVNSPILHEARHKDLTLFD